MHEFSLAIEVINLAQREAEKNLAEHIQEITIEVGDLSGVEADAFESALELLVKESILEKADNVFVVKSNFMWSDLGTWDELFKLVIECKRIAERTRADSVGADLFARHELPSCGFVFRANYDGKVFSHFG